MTAGTVSISYENVLSDGNAEYYDVRVDYTCEPYHSGNGISPPEGAGIEDYKCSVTHYVLVDEDGDTIVDSYEKSSLLDKKFEELTRLDGRLHDNILRKCCDHVVCG